MSHEPRPVRYVCKRSLVPGLTIRGTGPLDWCQMPGNCCDVPMVAIQPETAAPVDANTVWVPVLKAEVAPVVEEIPGPVEFQTPTAEPASLDRQVGGDHYKKMKIQHVEFVHANSIPYIEANAIKYICRHRDKNGRQDLEKAIHYLQILLDLEYGTKPDPLEVLGFKVVKNDRFPFPRNGRQPSAGTTWLVNEHDMVIGAFVGEVSAKLFSNQS